MSILQYESPEPTQPVAASPSSQFSIESSRDLFLRNRLFILYCSLGVIAVSVDVVTYWVLVNAVGLNHQIANVMSTLCGILTSFGLNATFTFRVRDRLWLRALSFITTGLCGLGLSALTLYVLVDRLHLDKNWAKAASLYVVLVQYNVNRLVSFRQ